MSNAKISLSDDVTKRKLAKFGEQIANLLKFVAHNVHDYIKKKMNTMNLTYNRLFKFEEKVIIVGSIPR